MSTISHLPAGAEQRGWSSLLYVKEMWASLAITVMWIAVAVSAVWGRTSSPIAVIRTPRRFRQGLQLQCSRPSARGQSRSTASASVRQADG